MDLFIHSFDESKTYNVKKLNPDRGVKNLSDSEKRTSSADYDVVSINSHSTAMSDEDFASAVSRAAAKDVEQNVPESRVAQLRAEVQSGSYKVDSTRIAEKLLGYRD